MKKQYIIKLSFILAFLLNVGIYNIKAQTTYINGATGNGDFEAGATGWTLANAATNQWFISNKYKCSGSNGAYVGTGSNNNNYTITVSQVSHCYKTTAISFTSGETQIALSFSYRCQGESTYDGLQVFLTNAVPVAGTACSSGDQIGSTWYNLQGTCTTANINIPSTYAGTTKYLVFQWKNDGSAGSNPAITLDDIVLTSSPCTPLTVACYCTSAASSSGDEDITNVTFGSINNTSACASLTGTQGVATGTADLYSNFFNTVAAPSVMQGQTVSTSVTITECAGTAYSHQVNIYIDFNQDGDLTDPGEEFVIFPYASSNTHTINYNITIPMTATVGNTLMRIVCKESSTMGPCLVSSYGETEDYKINITAATNCSGTPTAGTASAAPNTICAGGSSTLTLTGYTIASGITLQWQSSPTGGAPWSNIGGATSNTYVASPASDTYYQCVVTCTNSGLSATSNSVQVTIDLIASCYCTSSATSTSDMDITLVRFAGSPLLNNSTPTVSLVGSQGTATGTAGEYSDFWGSGVPIPSVQQGATYAFRVTIGGTAYSHRVDVYIDYNQDGDLTDPGESIPVFAYANPSLPNTTNINITIPLSAATGSTLMRVVCVESSSSSACGTYTWGETEDYEINITAAPACSGTPTAGTATSSIADFCNTGSPDLEVTGYSVASGLTFQWEYSNSNTPYVWSNISGADTTTYSVSPAINQTIYYRCGVSCGANTAYTNVVTVTNLAEEILTTNSPVTVTCNTAANMTATATGGTISWYTTATGGSAVATGGSYSPTVTANTTYYCAAGSGGATTNVGKPSWTSSDGYFGTSSGWGIRFDAYSAFTLVSVKVYPQTAGSTISVVLQDNTGTPVGSPVTFTAGPAGVAQTLTLNMSIPVGNDFRLVSGNGTYLGRGSTGVAFPYTAAGICSLTASEWGGTTTGTYYFFYDWVVSTGCESDPRTPVDVIVSGGVTAPVCSASPSPSNGATNVCPVGNSLTWGASNTACRTATGYRLYLGTDAGATNIYNGLDVGLVTTYPLPTLAASTVHYWKIVPYNTAGDATGCSTWSFTTATNPGSICVTNMGTGVTVLPGSPYSTLPYSSGAGTTSGAGNDLTSANTVSCGSTSYLTGEDKVWVFTPALSGSVTITLTSTGTWTGLMVYDNCPLSASTCGATAGNCIAYSQSSSGNKTLTVCVTAGVTYYVVLDSYSSPFNNPYSNLTISAPTGSVASNDLPCDAISLSLGVQTAGDNACTGSSLEPGKPSCWTTGILNTVWFSVVCPASGELGLMTTVGTLTNTQIAVYSGSCSSLSLVSGGCNVDMPGCGSSNASLLNLSGLTPGATYYIRVDGAYDLTGSFAIEAIDPSTQSFPVIPGQDCSLPLPTCATIINISDPGYANTGNICDFDGTNNCTSGERASVWYTIDIGVSGTLQFDIVPNDYDGTVGSETDYDFLVWKISGSGTTTNCAGIMADPGQALVACNFSYLGVTGLYPGGVGNPTFNGGTPWDAAYEAPISVTAGDQYLIVIQNYTQSTSGFTIDYTGSTPGTVNISATPSLVAWTGAVNTAWTNAGNWGGCGVPSCATSAVIPSYMPNMPVISSNVSVKDLTINPGATLTINNNNKLQICGNYLNNGTVNIGNNVIYEFKGTTAQTCINNSGTFSIPNVIIDNTGSGVTLAGGTSSNMNITGTLTFTNGILHTTNPPMVIMNAGSSVTGSSATRFVDGPMQKIGNTNFVFPIGDGSRWARLGITPTASTTFQAEYFYSGYSSTSLCVTPTPVLAGISSIEYWQLDRVAGTGNSAVTLYWEDAASSGITSCAAPPAGDLSVARYTGACWENKNITGGSVTGSCAGSSAGTITSDVITSFSPFTFSSKTAPLPVELLSFTGKSETGYNILHWTTITEINNDYFSLEKSSDGINFTELAVIKGAENSSSPINYNYKDMDPFYLDTYYRLKQVDLNGKFKYSNIVVISNDYNDKVSDFIDLFPNPASTIINLRFSSSYEANAEITICDYSGRILIDEERKIQIGNDQLTFDIDNLSKGVYYLKVNFTETGKTCYKRFIKN